MEYFQATHTPIDIEIPDILKSRLEDDYIAINHAEKVSDSEWRTRQYFNPNSAEVVNLPQIQTASSGWWGTFTHIYK